MAVWRPSRSCWISSDACLGKPSVAGTETAAAAGAGRLPLAATSAMRFRSTCSSPKRTLSGNSFGGVQVFQAGSFQFSGVSPAPSVAMGAQMCASPSLRRVSSAAHVFTERVVRVIANLVASLGDAPSNSALCWASNSCNAWLATPRSVRRRPYGPLNGGGGAGVNIGLNRRQHAAVATLSRLSQQRFELLARPNTSARPRLDGLIPPFLLDPCRGVELRLSGSRSRAQRLPQRNNPR